MFFSPDMLSLHRGRRRVSRTPTCRPCVAWLKDCPETRYYGVVLDVSPVGVRIRMLDLLPAGCILCFQMMRDEDFSVPLASPLEGEVVRVQEDRDAFVDHGLLLIQKKLARIESRPVELPEKKPTKTKAPRMYSLDITVGERPKGQSGR
jgi:hypothetical protein